MDFSIWHLLILLVIVVVIFGTKRLTSGAKDLGGAVKEFKKAMTDEPDSKKTDPIQQAVDPSKLPPPADVTRVERPPSANPSGSDQRPRD
ncbi:MAG TPA: twin-arginine translocase TatA/TatE family subunit [Xanthomonadaceae bacterium]|jgi:sec-independent protein translocase protein TatA|nr:twin-arginine translocase TatA/TatE family subunit [Xanthomonadaceae bacterium]